MELEVMKAGTNPAREKRQAAAEAAAVIPLRPT